MSDKYILEGHEVVVCGDLMEWARWLETTEMRVDETTIGDVYISTVFRGLDLSFGNGPPVLFETMIFGGKLNREMWRYSTWEEAEKGHKNAVNAVRKQVK